MIPDVRGRLVALVVAFASIPGVAAAQSDSVNVGSVLQLDPVVLAASSFALVFVAGNVLIYFRSDFLRRARRQSMTNPRASFGYGVLANIGPFGAYVLLEGLSSMVSVTSVFSLGFAVLFTGHVFLATVGFVTVGTVLLDRAREATLRQGLLVGATLSAVVLLIPVVGWFLWMLANALGLGGPTISWLRPEETIVPEEA